jgi:serine/threonine protein kinase
MQPPHDSEREVRIMKKHPGSNIIPLLESFYDGAGHLVLVLPFLPFTLEQIIHTKTISHETVKICLRDMFRALAHLHSHGIIHRDIKPANILMESPAGPTYLSDMGISWSPTDPGSEPADNKITDVCTSCYRPPEVLFGSRNYEPSLDLWSAGCVVAEVSSKLKAPLFKSGDLGTDLTLVLSIFETLGTPNEQMWPVSDDKCAHYKTNNFRNSPIYLTGER